MPNLADRGWRPLVDLTVYRLTNNILNRQGDLIIAGIVAVDKTSVGTYALAFSLTTAANTVFLTGIGSMTLTRFSATYAESGKFELGKSWQRMTYLTAFLSSWPLAILIAIGPGLSVILFHGKYPGLALYLVLIGVVAWLGRISGGGANIAVLFTLRNEKLVRKVFLMAAAMNVATDFVLMPLIGMYGAIVGTMIGTFFSSRFLNVQIRRRTRSSVEWSPLLLLSCLTAIVTAPVALLHRSFTLSICAVVVSLCLWATFSWRSSICPPEISSRVHDVFGKKSSVGTD
ncbi:MULTISPECIES: polysaccharide biosynthesis C-terminal domain-containing protein [Frankia]|nr:MULTISPECIES: oligosaccharide flippase family protein [Frankia]